MREISAETLNTLADKLDRLELTEAERAALDGIVARATEYEDEVAGFALGGLQIGGDLTRGGGMLGGALGAVSASRFGEIPEPPGTPPGHRK